MRRARILVAASLIALATGCGEDAAAPRDAGSPDPGDPGSPEVIKQLARQERSVEEFDMCEALRAARTDEELKELLDSESIWFRESLRDQEESISQHCTATPEENGDIGLSVSLMQGSEFVGAEADDPLVFPGCRAAPPESLDGTTWYRISCEPDLAVDGAVGRIDGPAVEPDILEDLLHDVLVAVSQQG